MVARTTIRSGTRFADCVVPTRSTPLPWRTSHAPPLHTTLPDSADASVLRGTRAAHHPTLKSSAPSAGHSVRTSRRADGVPLVASSSIADRCCVCHHACGQFGDSRRGWWESDAVGAGWGRCERGSQGSRVHLSGVQVSGAVWHLRGGRLRQHVPGRRLHPATLGDVLRRACALRQGGGLVRGGPRHVRFGRRTRRTSSSRTPSSASQATKPRTSSFTASSRR